MDPYLPCSGIYAVTEISPRGGRNEFNFAEGGEDVVEDVLSDLDLEKDGKGSGGRIG